MAVTLKVRGRRSGRTHATALVMANVEGDRYLGSMLGESRDWVHNVRAAGGEATIHHRRVEKVRLEEVPAAERAPILKAYLRRGGVHDRTWTWITARPSRSSRRSRTNTPPFASSRPDGALPPAAGSMWRHRTRLFFVHELECPRCQGRMRPRMCSTSDGGAGRNRTADTLIFRYGQRREVTRSCIYCVAVPCTERHPGRHYGTRRHHPPCRPAPLPA